ncbi:transcriptional regulator family: Fungal Specific TF [Penicillium concentricum]|uniref:Transcriptional regulator family: Fungal Specific TF n=1 Tax=Penicillium concentricum TaxID=293559 RepID=A0A9W9RTN7_9EURO|nr:transcriptional regulator family: Fungal Specific TF [Penicillium concentricum]KAJ5366047.1 transcriptional regulator family: Fungal Specific TF [Penicillium concentricum]
MNTLQIYPAPERDNPDTNEQPRKKRRKYIARACTECKRRKIKCNGQTPCQRCGRQHIECIYVENSRESPGEQDNFKQLFEQMRAMQDHITQLSVSIRSIASSEHSPGVSATGTYQLPTQRSLRRLSTTKEMSFQGPTTSAFSFDLAKSSLQQRGIVERAEAGDEGEMTREPSPLASPSAPNEEPGTRQTIDPLWVLPKAEALRLCRVYEEEMGIMYPILELSEILEHVHLLYGPMDRVLGPTRQPGNNGLVREDVHILRVVFACALTAEARGRSEQAIALFDSVREVQDNCVWGPPDIKSIIFLTLVSMFYFQMDEEILAWRTVGIVERMCLEKGLHRRETLNQPAITAVGKDRVLRLFWSIYILDMRWSFGTGMPFALEDTDIDPWLPEPDEKTPYLRVMIRYSRIAAKVWKFISAFNNTNEIRKEEMNYLDWQVLRWVHAIPDSLRLDHPSSAESETAIEGSRSLRRLRALLYLRANQLRMLIHRPVLHTSAHVMRYPGESETVVEIAKDTIRFITRLNDTSDIYQLQQVAFNWFLVSALAALFLAVAQAPTQFSGSCKEEFYWALELVKGVSTQSYISRRLWKSIRSLRKLGPQLGLGVQKKRLDIETRAESERINVNDSPPLPQSASTHSHTPQDGEQMTQELMEWFEAVGNLEDQIMGMGTGPVPDGGPYQQMPDGGFVFDYGEELSSVMKDFF